MGPVVKKLLILFLTVATLHAATVVNVYWETLNGKKVGFITNNQKYYILKMCVRSNGDVNVGLAIRGDSPIVPKYYQTVLIVNKKPSCKVVLLYFNKLPENLQGVKVQPDVAIDVAKVAGIYADLVVNGHVKIDRIGYLKVVKVNDKAVLNCISVKTNAISVVIGDAFNITVTNNCKVPYLITIKGDMENFADINIESFTLKPHTSKKVQVVVPKFVGVTLTGVLGIGPTIGIRGIYMNANGTEVYYVPVYDYFSYFIRPNAKAVWYENGMPVSKVKAGSMVTGCVEVPSIVPITRVPPIEAKLKVIEDLMFMPDKVVAKKDVIISHLPFTKCVSFIAEKSWNTRGYKLQLDVKEDVKLFTQKVPLLATMAVGPELQVR